jgi:hypothetical protein
METTLALAIIFDNKPLADFVGECLSIDTKPVVIEDVALAFHKAYEVLEYHDEPDSAQRKSDLIWLAVYDSINVMTDAEMFVDYIGPYLRAGAQHIYAAAFYEDYDGSDDDVDEGMVNEDDVTSNRPFIYKAFLKNEKIQVISFTKNRKDIPDDLMEALHFSMSLS